MELDQNDTDYVLEEHVEWSETTTIGFYLVGDAVRLCDVSSRIGGHHFFRLANRPVYLQKRSNIGLGKRQGDWLVTQDRQSSRLRISREVSREAGFSTSVQPFGPKLSKGRKRAL